MKKHQIDFNAIPAAACFVADGNFALGDNGESAKSAPVRLLARSSQPITHWAWGRVVHDLSGMRMHKDRLAIDYVHDPKEIIGYLNHFEAKDEGLVASGAITPNSANPRATEVIENMRNGVPYEASINFAGEHLKYEELEEGQVAQVNGYELSGPAIIIREWDLRGVAICPYGADMNTESAVNFAAGKTIRGEQYIMNEEENVVVEEAQPESVEEPVTEEAAEVAVEAEEQDEDKQFSVSELARFADKFGAEAAVEAVLGGKTYTEVLEDSFAKLKQEKSEVVKEGAPAVEFSVAPKVDGKMSFLDRIATN